LFFCRKGDFALGSSALRVALLAQGSSWAVDQPPAAGGSVLSFRGSPALAANPARFCNPSCSWAAKLCHFIDDSVDFLVKEPLGILGGPLNSPSCVAMATSWARNSRLSLLPGWPVIRLARPGERLATAELGDLLIDLCQPGLELGNLVLATGEWKRQLCFGPLPLLWPPV